MPVKLEQCDLHHVDFGDTEEGNVLIPFPVIYRYTQIIAETSGYDAHETGRVIQRLHYGYAPNPVIRISNLISSSQIIKKPDADQDGKIWILCHRHRNAGESSTYAHGMLMARDPASGLAPAAIEYVTADGFYTIVTRRPPPGAPSAIVYSSYHDDRRGSRILTTAIDCHGDHMAPEAYLFSYVALPSSPVTPKSNQ